jgi:isopenicillin N synthase-like dioxygenase
MDVLEDDDFDGIANALVNDGFAVVKRTGCLAEAYGALFHAGKAFFGKSLEEKAKAHPPPGRNCGYRPVGEEYSTDASLPDIKESVTYVPSEVDFVSSHGADVQAIYALIRAAIEVVDPFSMNLMTVLARRFGSNDPIYAAADSQFAVNVYPMSGARDDDVLIQPHEDGCLVTLLASTAAGLELYKRTGEFVRCDEVIDHLVIVAGISLTIATGGAIPPTYHRVVRRSGVHERYTIAYDVTADLNRAIDPWVTPESGERRRLDDEARYTLTRFGLPPLGG